MLSIYCGRVDKIAAILAKVRWIRPHVVTEIEVGDDPETSGAWEAIPGPSFDVELHTISSMNASIDTNSTRFMNGTSRGWQEATGS